MSPRSSACAGAPGKAKDARITLKHLRTLLPALEREPVRQLKRALRVEGIVGLRVIDASVLPEIPQAMVNAATIAVAERVSDLVLAG
ncbi:MAG: hypothetical protein JO326_05165 [Acetobacteraceae bacterium]|nr:hypothetical protein [Acetobacteraceae bacterium]